VSVRALLVGFTAVSLLGSAVIATPANGWAPTATALAAAATETGPDSVSEPVSPLLSPALGSLPESPQTRTAREVPEGGPERVEARGKDQSEALNEAGPAQREIPGEAPADLVPVNTFAGGTTDNYAGQSAIPSPPDTVGDVGPNHYVQMVNSTVQIWDKQGTSLVGPLNINTLWAGFPAGTPCRETNDGDPIVLYDQAANRWMLAQFSVNGASYQMCIAYSTTASAVGTYYVYAFNMPAFPDYEKFGIWPDGLYMSTYDFPVAGDPVLGAYVFDRSALLNGGSASYLRFVIPSGGGPRAQRILPADWDGSTAPPAGAPNPFLMSVDAEVQGGAQDRLELYNFHVDWTTPANSTFTLDQTLPTEPFNIDIGSNCMDSSLPTFRSCVPQPGTAVKVDDLSNRLMWRLQYRNFGGHQSMVTNQTVNSGNNTAGVRWYELRSTGASWSIHQQNTFAPTDSAYRWMGSAAMDGVGNIALGYSISDATSLFPSISYTGRRVGAPLNQLTEPETRMFTGVASQTQSGTFGKRWGDYSAMSVDPVDECTFWYTQMHIGAGSTRETRIGTAKFTSCSQPTAQLRLVKVTDPSTVSADKWTLKAEAAAPLEEKNISTPGGSGSLTKVFAGTPYALSESGPDGYTPSNWVCTMEGASTQYPGQSGASVTLSAGDKVTCTIVNTRDVGSLTITKAFDPQSSGYTGTFDVNYNCVDGADPVSAGTVKVAAGQSQTIPGLPTGTVCTVTEPTLPSAPAGWAFNPPSFAPAGGQVTVTSKGQSTGVTVVNSVTQMRVCPVSVKAHKPRPKKLGKRVLTDKIQTQKSSCALVKPVVVCKPLSSAAAGRKSLCSTKATKKGRITVTTKGSKAVRVTVTVRAKPKAGFSDVWKPKEWRKSWKLR
jgi:hypothetical protein